MEAWKVFSTFLMPKFTKIVFFLINSFGCPDNRTVDPEWSCPEFQENAE